MAQSSLENVKDNLMQDRPQEDRFTRQIETQTARIPSIGYFGLAVSSMVLSAFLAIFSERKSWANFVGLWAPSFLLIGIYNKLVKLEQSEGRSFLGRDMGQGSMSSRSSQQYEQQPLATGTGGSRI